MEHWALEFECTSANRGCSARPLCKFAQFSKVALSYALRSDVIAYHVTDLGPAGQVNSEFQAYKHIECMEPGELMRASSPLEAIIGMHPTLILTNALPYDIQVTVWQVRPVAYDRRTYEWQQKISLVVLKKLLFAEIHNTDSELMAHLLLQKF